ncbi:hypothetical protein [Caballeronia sp. M1242]|uniref:hypothetical protein n=1 Tax=Caballeronia sp. M1242 TaxID=2814653 RepID=UPI0019D05816|nr:hypothetical protein [Caballeronia sp. M1242]QSN65161.1 hypothetical protein JYK05_24810 [Caballeronia sp. M1242]
MRSHLINGAARSALDAQILDFVSKHATCLPGPRSCMRVGIMNESGALYRIIEAEGMIEMIRIDKFLLRIGCAEQFSHALDALYGVPQSDHPKEAP